jgi:glycosyltransferase involved in cell wall biosynthesis
MKKIKSVAIVSPCYNEFDVIIKFLDELESILGPTGLYFHVIVVDDKSNDRSVELLQSYRFSSSNFTLKVIRLHYNVGHQDAIRQGLKYTNSLEAKFDRIVVMDSDGEDDPTTIIEMIQMEPSEIILVERGKRQESFGFKMGYFFYKLVFNLLTGKRISFGNFSMFSNDVLESIANQKYFHFSSFLSKGKGSLQKLKSDRRMRIDGKSKMNFQSLLFHGLYSMIEFAEEILFTFIKFLLVIFLITLTLIGYVIYSKFYSEKAITGWASSLSSNLIIMCLIILSTIVIGLISLSIKKIILQKDQKYDQII